MDSLTGLICLFITRNRTQGINRRTKNIKRIKEYPDNKLKCNKHSKIIMPLFSQPTVLIR